MNWRFLFMKNENIKVNKNMLIEPDSEIIYASSIVVGGDEAEIRLILFNKRLISNEDGMEIINESDTQIIINKSTARKLKELLTEQLHE